MGRNFLTPAVLPADSTVGGQPIGYRGVVLSLSNANVTVSKSDNGKGYYKNNTTAYTYYIPDGLDDGTVITFANLGSAGNLTISMSGAEVLRLGGTTSTGSRTIAPYGEATFHKVGGQWLSGGVGLT